MPRFEDISPDRDHFTRDLDSALFHNPPQWQSASGRGLTIAGWIDGKRIYAGNNSGVWRSNDGGENWRHMTRRQPPLGTTSVPGALLSLDVYDLAVCPTDPNIVLAATGRDIRVPDQSGIYRSNDGGVNWTRVRAFKVTGQISATDEPSLFFAAGGVALVKSIDFGVTWSDVPLPLFTSGTDQVWHVVAGPKPEATRRIYALGTRLWFTVDGGANWQVDPNFPMKGGPPANAVGLSTRVLAIHPSDPTILYATSLVFNAVVNKNLGTIWRGTASAAGGTWSVIATLPEGPSPTTDSGTVYLAAQQAGPHFYLVVSDRSAAYLTIGDSPVSLDRLDGDVHMDPHAIWLSPDFRWHKDTGGGRGRMWMVNDGGVYVSTDGGANSKIGRGFSALSPINVAVSALSGRLPAIRLDTGDNGAFFSSDGGRNWRSADYQQGDNDAAFVNPRQPAYLYVFAPRSSGVNQNVKMVLYIALGPLDNRRGTPQRHEIIGPPSTDLPLPRQVGWNCVSFFTQMGYRPLISTLPTETPRVGGDFICIRYATATDSYLMRTTSLATSALGAAALSQPTVFTQADWTSAATSESAGTNVFQQGPKLPSAMMSIVQASGGHNTPVFYVGDNVGLWRWTNGMATWQQLVPQPGSAPQQAVRFYVDPYRDKRIFLIDKTHVWRSGDGGGTWAINAPLEGALTESVAFPVALPGSSTPNEALLQDMVFDPSDPAVIIAVGPAGVFITNDDGANWSTMARFSALQTRVMSTFLDTTTEPLLPSLYVSTPYRGLLKITYVASNPLVNVLRKMGVADIKEQAKKFEVFRKTPYTDPLVASADPTTPAGKLQKALTDAITAKASASGHGHILKTRDPNAPDFRDIFPIPFTIADVTGATPYPVAHYNGDELDFIASEAKLAVLFAAIELRTMLRRFANDLGIISTQVFLDALKFLEPKILNKVPLIKDAKNVLGQKLPIKDLQRLPDYTQIFEIIDSGPQLQINFKGAIFAEPDPNIRKKDYDFGRCLFNMIVNSGDETAQNCIDAIGYAFINGALEAGGFFERLTPADPKTFRGLWVGGNYAVERIRGVMSVNDGPAQFAGTTKQFAKLLALVRAGTFADPADPDGDLMQFLLKKAQNGTFGTALSFGFAFTYEMNSLGVAQLGFKNPLADWVFSEVAMVRNENPKQKRYVVAWQNMEFEKKGSGPPTVPTVGGHLLYSKTDIIDIISSTVAAYE
jgi:hypothetical protein